MNDVVWKSFLTGAAILFSAGPLSLFLLLPLAWDHAMGGELVRAAGWTVVASIGAAIFGTLVYRAIDTAYSAGIKQGEMDRGLIALLPFTRSVGYPVELAQNALPWGNRCGVVHELGDGA